VRAKEPVEDLGSREGTVIWKCIEVVKIGFTERKIYSESDWKQRNGLNSELL
jgi:hypothetical protein